LNRCDESWNPVSRSKVNRVSRDNKASRVNKDSKVSRGNKVNRLGDRVSKDNSPGVRDNAASRLVDKDNKVSKFSRVNKLVDRDNKVSRVSRANKANRDNKVSRVNRVNKANRDNRPVNRVSKASRVEDRDNKGNRVSRVNKDNRANRLKVRVLRAANKVAARQALPLMIPERPAEGRRPEAAGNSRAKFGNDLLMLKNSNARLVRTPT